MAHYGCVSKLVIMGHIGPSVYIVMWTEVLVATVESLFSRWNYGAHAKCLDEKRQFICRLIDPFAGRFPCTMTGTSLNADERW